VLGLQQWPRYTYL